MLQRILYNFETIIQEIIRTAAKVWTYMYMLVDYLTIDHLIDIYY